MEINIRGCRCIWCSLTESFKKPFYIEILSYLFSQTAWLWILRRYQLNSGVASGGGLDKGYPSRQSGHNCLLSGAYGSIRKKYTFLKANFHFPWNFQKLVSTYGSNNTYIVSALYFFFWSLEHWKYCGVLHSTVTTVQKETWPASCNEESL